MVPKIRFGSDTNTIHMPSVNYLQAKYLLMSLSLLAAYNGVSAGKTDDNPDGKWEIYRISRW